MATQKIVIIEDDARTLEICERIFMEQGYDVLPLGPGEDTLKDAIAYFERVINGEEAPYAIIFDHDLGNNVSGTFRETVCNTGADLVGVVKEQDVFNNTYLFGNSASKENQASFEQAGIEPGCFFTKPSYSNILGVLREEIVAEVYALLADIETNTNNRIMEAPTRPNSPCDREQEETDYTLRGAPTRPNSPVELAAPPTRPNTPTNFVDSVNANNDAISLVGVRLL